MEEEISQQVLLFGFIIAVIMGFVGNRSQFCTMGAVSDWVNIGEKNRLRAWLLSIAVAILGVSLLEIFQIISIDLVRRCGSRILVGDLEATKGNTHAVPVQQGDNPILRRIARGDRRRRDHALCCFSPEQSRCGMRADRRSGDCHTRWRASDR